MKLKITQVMFKGPVGLGSCGAHEHYDCEKREMARIEVSLVQGYLVLENLPGLQPGMRKRVPMSNVSDFTETPVEEAKPERAEPALASPTGAAPARPPLPAARGVNASATEPTP